MKKIILGIGVAAAFLTLGYAVSNAPEQPTSENTESNSTATMTATNTAALTAPRTAPAGYKEYYDAHYRFSLFYPESLTVQKFDEGGGAATIIFQNPGEAKGFQVFVVPYDGEQVSEERFRQDIPSGVRRNVQDVVVDGAKGAAFYSADPILGETREVWFIKNGHLFEVTTLKVLEADLLEVLGTWKFI